ncbi:MAG: acetate--CoA ligase [Verrucomicrobia bacterium]|nr:acetate--CoA ligase [Verrucomicrobiota bacterium]
MTESRVFKPSAEFSKKARISSMAQYKKMHEESIKHPDKFFGREAKELQWTKPFTKVLDWKCPNAKWFIGGKLNVSENCLDRHLDGPRKSKAALIWEGEPGEKRVLTYQQLHREVCSFANVLKRHKVKKGDRVIIYMPMIPEAAMAMRACTRSGAMHSVIFGGFSAESIKDRVLDCGAKIIITADGGYRRGAVVPLKKNVDDALKGKDTPVETVIVYRRTSQDVHIEEGRDVWWHRELKPKGILHTTGGYLLHAQMTCKYVFDLRDDDVYWCTADIGWVTGHTYMVYGPLALGATSLMFEGAPNWPENDRFWKIIEEYAVTVFYTAPTAIRAFMKWGDEWLKKHDLSSLRLLGTVGEPINPEAWMWYHNKVGGGKCPIVDTWWQTETGGHMITPIPGATPTTPGTATLPFFGVDAAIVDDLGKEVGVNEQGKLVIRKPWPSMLRGIWGDKKRYQEAYWSEFKGWYFAGDGARRDKQGNFWIIGRIDDVLNVAGHRLGTAEVESALVSHPAVAEAAVVGRPDEMKGQGVVCFVTVKEGITSNRELAEELKKHVRKVIGPVATPDEVRFAAALPKTRSGKIMRRLLKQIAAGELIKGDTTTLEDINVIAQLAAGGED